MRLLHALLLAWGLQLLLLLWRLRCLWGCLQLALWLRSRAGPEAHVRLVLRQERSRLLTVRVR